MQTATPQPYDEHRITRVAEEAEQAFWAVVAQRFPEAKSGDFSPVDSYEFAEACKKAVSTWVTSNTPAPMPYLTVADLPTFQRRYKNPTTTAAEYYEATLNHAKNPAGEQMDKGNEPYLILMELLNFGMEPLVPVHDIHRAKADGGQITLELMNGPVTIPANTILAWS